MCMDVLMYFAYVSIYVAVVAYVYNCICWDQSSGGEAKALRAGGVRISIVQQISRLAWRSASDLSRRFRVQGSG